MINCTCSFWACGKVAHHGGELMVEPSYLTSGSKREKRAEDVLRCPIPSQGMSPRPPNWPHPIKIPPPPSWKLSLQHTGSGDIKIHAVTLSYFISYSSAIDPRRALQNYSNPCLKSQFLRECKPNHNLSLYAKFSSSKILIDQLMGLPDRASNFLTIYLQIFMLYCLLP